MWFKLCMLARLLVQNFRHILHESFASEDIIIAPYFGSSQTISWPVLANINVEDEYCFLRCYAVHIPQLLMQ
jgi:hypothetical protein